MPWFRLRYTPPAARNAWTAAGRQGVPPTEEYVAQFADVQAAQAEAEALRDRLLREAGSAWVWLTEVPPPPS